MTRKTMLILAFVFFSAITSYTQDFDPNYLSTFSIIARDPDTGELGMAVQSKVFAVGYRTWDAKGGVAVIAHQASSNPYYGKIGLELLEAGLSPQQALDMLVRSDEQSSSRQVAILDIKGRTAAFTGSGASDYKGHKCGVDYCAQGNTLGGPDVVNSIARTFESSKGQPLAERMLAALDAGQAAGGDQRGMQSAAMMIVKPLSIAGFGDVALDIRVNDSPQPLVELRRLLKVFRSGEMITKANTTFNSGDQQKGLQMMVALRDELPEKDNIWVALANMYLKMNRKTDALNAIRRAVELNPANKRQLPKNTNFESIKSDPEFLKIVGS